VADYALGTFGVGEFNSRTKVSDANPLPVKASGTGTGSAEVQGTAADGAAAVGKPVQVGGKDGSGNAQALLTDTSGQPLLAATENHIGQVSGHSTVVTVSPTVDTAIYASGDLMGGKLTLASAARVAGGTGMIHSLTIVDQDNEKAALDIVFFESDPTGTTFTDQAALDVADADMLNVVGVVSVSASDYVSFVDNAVATLRNIGLSFKLDSGTSLFAAIVSRGTPTYTAATDVQVKVGILMD
jgi:hypothetical protein